MCTWPPFEGNKPFNNSYWYTRGSLCIGVQTWKWEGMSNSDSRKRMHSLQRHIETRMIMDNAKYMVHLSLCITDKFLCVSYVNILHVPPVVGVCHVHPVPSLSVHCNAGVTQFAVGALF